MPPAIPTAQPPNPRTTPEPELSNSGGSVEANGTTAGNFRYKLTADPSFDERMLGVEFTDGTDVKYRIVVPRGQVTETEEISLVRTAPVKLGVTFTALAVDALTPLVTFLMKDPAYAA